VAVTSSPDLGAMPQPSNTTTPARQMQRRATIGDVPRVRPDRLERSDKNWCFLRHAQGEIRNIKVSNAAGTLPERARTAHTSLAGAALRKLCLGPDEGDLEPNGDDEPSLGLSEPGRYIGQLGIAAGCSDLDLESDGDCDAERSLTDADIERARERLGVKPREEVHRDWQAQWPARLAEIKGGPAS
jgi:hypothetical protein